ncbi:MAG: EAL domain-containing protein [Bryobacterales bacterium]|nr:EAL domain-containing protein [Bryobacterales bacterium]
MGLWPITSPPSQLASTFDAAASQRQILVVDAEVGNLQNLTGTLENAGYAVGTVSTAGQVLEQLRESEVELILLGETLPGMDGLDLLRLLRAAWTPQQLPVIMLAPDSHSEVEAEALEAGANDCMAPSVEGCRAVARVRSQLQLKDAGQGVRDRAERVFRATAVSTDVIWEWNIPTDVLWFSGEWGRLTGRPMGGPARCQDWLALVHPEDVDELETALLLLREDTERFEFGQEYRLLLPSGEIRWIYCRANVERDRHGELLRLTGLQTDITRNKSIDWLTQLPNRENILDRVDRMLAEAGEPGALPFALLLLDLDRFRVINESLGPTAGDRILREVAMRLERATRTIPASGRPEDYLARVHGDTFLLILNDVASPELARSIADRLQGQIRRPLQLGGREIRLSASIGFALSRGDHYKNAFELHRDAEIAMHQAKALGRAKSVHFDTEMRNDAMHRMDLEIDLRQALERRQLVLYYQPKIDIATGELAGFEALLRWRHPRLGLVAPLKFIPIAEETGMIIPIGAWAMEDSARQFALWRQMLPNSSLQVSVNLSVKQFFDRDLVDLVTRVVRELRLPPGAFCLEVTESVLIGEIQGAAEILSRLHNAGVGLMIDDFGTGYSSLNYLTNLPFDALKIDRSFVSRLEVDDNCAEVVKAVVTLARNLKLDVVAEGVETAQQLDCLRRIECPFAQGYLFAKPVDVETATKMVLASRGC